MPKIIEEFVRKKVQCKYDLSFMLDGQARRFFRGKDFKCSKHGFSQTLRFFALSHGFTLMTSGATSKDDWFDAKLVKN